MIVQSRIILLLCAILGYTIGLLDATVTASVNTALSSPDPWAAMRGQFARRMLKPEVLVGLRENITLRQQFCLTCRPRNCQRRGLIRRCAFDSSKAKKCACCNFCPQKWRQLRSTNRPQKDSKARDGLEEIISLMQKKLPPETARICKQHDVRCSSAQLCLLNIQNLPVCRCLPEAACGRGTIDTIVCAANGVSYLSRCHLLVAACRLHEKLQPLRTGPCNPNDVETLLAEQIRLPIRRKLRWRRRMRRDKRRGKRRRYVDRLLQLIASNQRERRRLLREMKRLRRLHRNRRIVG